jgi:RHS repeat-associated protein
VTTSLPFGQSSAAIDLESGESDYVVANDSSSLSLTGNSTIEFWVKFESLPTSGNTMGLVNKWSSGVKQSYQVWLYNDSGTLKLQTQFGTDAATNVKGVRFNWTPSTGTWYHVAVTFTPTNAASSAMEFFLNGSSQGNGSVLNNGSGSSIYNNDVALEIGRAEGTHYLDGQLDDLRIWNTVRTGSEISNNKSVALTGSESGLVAYYPFESGTADSSLVQQFDLGYATASNSGQLLQSITERGTTGTASALPATRFEYKPEFNPINVIEQTWINDENIDVDLNQNNTAVVDVNGDGLLDIVKSEGTGTNTWKVFKNTGSSWNSTPELWVNNVSIDANLVDPVTRLVDVTGDSLPDIVKSNEGSDGSRSTWKVWRNTGSSWDTTTETWVNNDHVEGARFEEPKTGLIDVNGDGLADIIKSETDSSPVNWKVYKNTGSSWLTNSTGGPEDWQAPANLDLSNSNVGLFDVNSDGLPDLVKVTTSGTNNTWYVYKNTGSSWSTSPETWINNANIDAYIGKDNVTLADVNGDGFVDIIKAIDNFADADEWKVLYNKGDSWSTSWQTWIDPSSNVGLDTRYVRIADATGDGIAEVIDGHPNGGGDVTWRVFKNNTVAPALLSKIINSQGGTISFDYTKSTFYDNTGADSLSDLPFPLWLVSTMTVDNGMSNSHQTTDVTNYSYKDGFYDWQDREFRGFGEVTETLPNTAKRKYIFHQDDALKGRLANVQTTDSLSIPYAKTENVWGIATSSGVMTIRLDEEKEYTHDGATASAKVKEVEYQYDSYGNVTKISELGDTSISTDNRYIYNEYTASTSAWLVNTLKHTYRNDATDSAKMSETWLYYDQHSGNSDAPHFGDVTKEVRWLSGGSNPETNYTYDSYGNVATEKDANNRTTTYTYDTTKTYPATVTNAKSQQTTYNYDLGTGNLLSQTDPNGLVTSYEYDVFGRISKEIKPYDNSSYPSKSYQYSWDGIAPESILISKRETASNSATLDVVTIIDGLGRKIQTRADAEDTTKQRVTDTFYDVTGEVKKETVSYLASSSASLTPTPTPTPQFSLSDKTSNANTLTNNGATSATASTPFGDSTYVADIESSETDYLIANDSSSLSITGNSTIEFWVKFESLPSSGSLAALVSKWAGSNYSHRLILYNDSGTYKMQAEISKNGGNTGADVDTVRWNWTPSTGTWYHVALTNTVANAAATEFEFFVNGSSQGNGSVLNDSSVTSVYDGTAGLELGRVESGSHFDGLLDEVRIWNTVRTGSEITNNKSVELTGSESGLVAYYQLEEIPTSPSSPDSWYSTPDPTAKYTELDYDILGRVSMVTSPKGDSRTTAYDHWKVTNIDEKGSIKRNFFNAFDKITSVEEVLGATTSATLYTYNARDDLTQIIDDMTNVFGFTYDTLSRKTAQSDPDMGNWSYGYDAVGNLTSTTDARGTTTTRTYDELNRVATVNYPSDTDTSYTYDVGKIGVLSIATDSAGTVSYTYDNRLRKTQESRIIDGTTKTTSYAFDAADRLTSQTNPDSEQVNYTFNNQGEIETATGSASLVSNFDYNALGKITKKDFGNGVTTNYTYNTNDFRLNRIQTASLFDKNYAYDAVGNIASITDNLLSKTQTFTYDDLDRLKTATESAGFNYAYDYNSIGNLTKFTNAGVENNYTYGSGGAKPHALTASGSALFAYDANGNLASDSANLYEYNEANQLKRVKSATNSATIAEYLYDFNGNRMVKKNYTNGSLANTVYSWSDSFETKVIEGGATETTVYYFANKELVAKKKNDGTMQYVHTDHLGSTSVVTNSGGTLVESTSYDPWGEVLSGGTQSKFGYTGQENDSETGLNYYGARYYGSDVRRFTQPDKLIQNIYNPQMLNRYSYAANNPLKYVDPSGHAIVFSGGKISSTYFSQPQQQKKPQTVQQFINGTTQPSKKQNTTTSSNSNTVVRSGSNNGGSSSGVGSPQGSGAVSVLGSKTSQVIEDTKNFILYPQHTRGVCGSGNIGMAAFGAGSGCIVQTPNREVGFVGSLGGGGTTGIATGVGLSGMYSTAQKINQLKGQDTFGGWSAWAIAVDGSMDKDNPNIKSLNVGVSVGPDFSPILGPAALFEIHGGSLYNGGTTLFQY